MSDRNDYKKDQKKVLIVTALPFRIHGNQSLLRFTRMFLKNNYEVSLFSAGSDDRGEIREKHESLKFFHIPKFSSKWNPLHLYNIIRSENKEGYSSGNHYEKIKSYDILPPFGLHNRKTMVKKWISFIGNFINNILCVLFIVIRHHKKAASANAIIGYEYGYSITAKIISIIYGKTYINKYQGTVLEASKRNLSNAKKYYPSLYYGTNKSDLCIMVNDDSDGEFYARAKGCKNVYLTTHGVGVHDYEDNHCIPNLIKQNKDKFILFNNATGSRWKRTDRILRAMALLPREVLDRILLVTTYFADDKQQLIEFSEKLGLQDQVLFLEKINHIESNAFIRYSDVLIMTNDMTNLGNPAIEALYYGTPVISLDERTMADFVKNDVDGFLIPIHKGMDQEMANVIQRLCTDEVLYSEIKRNVNLNATVFSLEHQQKKEFQQIINIIE